MIDMQVFDDIVDRYIQYNRMIHAGLNSFRVKSSEIGIDAGINIEAKLAVSKDIDLVYHFYSGRVDKVEFKSCRYPSTIMINPDCHIDWLEIGSKVNTLCLKHGVSLGRLSIYNDIPINILWLGENYIKDFYYHNLINPILSYVTGDKQHIVIENMHVPIEGIKGLRELGEISIKNIIVSHDRKISAIDKAKLGTELIRQGIRLGTTIKYEEAYETGRLS